MFRLVSAKDYPDHAQINLITSELRRVFCEVFTNAYTERLGPALEQAIAEGKVNSAEDTKTSQNEVLRGFSDLLVKSKFFTQPIDL